MLGDELIVAEVRIVSADAVNLFHLSGRQSFVRIETPAAREQPLSPQNLVQTRDAAREIVPRIEERRIRVSHFSRTREQLISLPMMIRT